LALFASGDQRGIENPLVDMVAVRAGFMENMVGCHPGLKGYPDSAEKAFMTGILSVLEKVYDISMDEVVRKLSLSDDVKDALVSRQGTLGELLNVAELLEKMEFRQLGTLLDEMGVSLDDVIIAQKKAFSWRKGMA
jgi:EAL and modified HD-GYP domain-containing signal transduction protein